MSREKILAFVQAHGPVIPSQIGKEVGTSILFASAMLSELVARKELKVSSVKIGGSPLYYIPGQEKQLEQFSGKLHEKEQQAYALLKEKQILRDAEQTPVTRVALRSLKDFAIPLEVSFGSNTEIFWRWHSLSSEQSESFIRSLLTPTAQTKVQKPARHESRVSNTSEEPAGPVRAESSAIPSNTLIAPPKATRRPRTTRRSEQQSTGKELHGFARMLQGFFEKHNIEILQKLSEKKNGESEGFIRMSTSLGPFTFYYISKHKKSLTDKDVSQALAKAQVHNSAVIILSPGELSKQGDQMLTNLKTIHFVRME